MSYLNYKPIYWRWLGAEQTAGSDIYQNVEFIKV